MKFKIGIREYKISLISSQAIEVLTHKPADTICGFTDYYQGKIIINADMSDDVREETLIHEVLHCLLDNSGIEEVSRQVKEGANLSELVATILAPRLHALLLENDVDSALRDI